MYIYYILTMVPHRLTDQRSNVDDVLNTFGMAKIDDLEEEKYLLETYEKSRSELRMSFNTRFR